MIMMIHLPSLRFTSYFHVFPLLDTELGLGWHQDSAYHVSVIQSILNIGYPSIGQHGAPLLFYPSLSHHIDAFIILLTGVEPYDSYGLLYHFKKFLLVSSVLVFVAYTFRRSNIYIIFIAFFLVMPILGELHTLGSHSLWVTSLLLILATPKVFEILIKEGNISAKEYFLIFILVLLLSLGKVSSGFMYAVFVGIALLIKEPKNKLVYALGTGWIIFFLLYSKAMHNYSSSGGHGIDFSHLNTLFKSLQLGASIYMLLIVLMLFTYFNKNRNNFIVMLSSILSLLVMRLVTNINLAFNSNDTWYFSYALSFMLVLFVIQVLAINIQNFKHNNSKLAPSVKQLLTLSLIISAFYLATFFPKNKIDTKIKPRTQIDTKFKTTNSKLLKEDSVKFHHVVPFQKLYLETHLVKS
jgi:hypothetical protein